MMRLAFLFLVAASCAREPSRDVAPKPAPGPGVAFAQPPQQPPKAMTKVELTAVTLADDCGGEPPMGRPAKAAADAKTDRAGDIDPNVKAKRARGDYKGDSMRADVAHYRCEQTSMQLAIVATDAAKIQIKSVELLDESGASLGALTASKPTRWSDATSTYEAWDESFAASSTSNVSYVLSQPDWAHIGNRWNRTFTVKAVVSVGGADQTTQKSVTIEAEATLPPNVKT